MDDLIKRLLSRAEYEDRGAPLPAAILRSQEDVGALLREAAEALAALTAEMDIGRPQTH